MNSKKNSPMPLAVSAAAAVMIIFVLLLAASKQYDSHLIHEGNGLSGNCDLDTLKDMSNEDLILIKSNRELRECYRDGALELLEYRRSSP